MRETGYAIVPGVLTAAECDDLLALPELQTRDHRAGVRHLMRVPAIRELAVSPKLQDLAGQRKAFRATFFDKSPIANWLVP